MAAINHQFFSDQDADDLRHYDDITLPFTQHYRPQWYQRRKWVTCFNWLQVLAFAALVLLSTGPLVKAVLSCFISGNRVPSQHAGSYSAGPTAPIPGIAYTLFELECRTWHRYRGTPTFSMTPSN